MRMKTKNRSSERSRRISQSYNPKLKTYLTLSFKFGFSFLACCFLTSLAGAGISSEQRNPTNFLVRRLAETSQDANTANVPAASSAAQVRQKLPQGSFPVARNPNSRLGRQLWRARINIPESKKDKRSKNELQRIIQQIRSVEFEPEKEKQTPEPLIVVEPVPTIEPNENETLPVTEAPKEPAEKEIPFKLPYEPISDQTLQMLENLSQHPDRLENPFELGEVLFLSGNMKEAAVFYQEALNRKGADDVWSAHDRAWILFQIGNCLRDDDLPTTTKMYRQLITEYPDLPWADLAKARSNLIDWYQKDNPRALIAENQF